METATLNGHTEPVTGLAYSSDGKVLASASSDRSLVLWDPARLQKQTTLFGHSGPVTSLAYAPDGRTLTSGGYFGQVFVWKTSDLRGPIVLRGDEGPSLGLIRFTGCEPVAFTPDGKLLAMSSGRRIILWDCQRMAKHMVLEERDKQDRPGFGFAESVGSLTFAPDGKTLASQCSNHISLWDVATGKKQKEYPLETVTISSSNGMGLGESQSRRDLRESHSCRMDGTSLRPASFWS